MADLHLLTADDTNIGWNLVAAFEGYDVTHDQLRCVYSRPVSVAFDLIGSPSAHNSSVLWHKVCANFTWLNEGSRLRNFFMVSEDFFSWKYENVPVIRMTAMSTAPM